MMTTKIGKIISEITTNTFYSQIEIMEGKMIVIASLVIFIGLAGLAFSIERAAESIAKAISKEPINN